MTKLNLEILKSDLTFDMKKQGYPTQTKIKFKHLSSTAGQVYFYNTNQSL